MQIKLLLSAASVALAATVGSVSAADQFATLDGIEAAPMSATELAAVKGMHVHFLDANGGFHRAGNPDQMHNWFLNDSPDGNLVAPSYHGLCVAPPIGIPGTPSQCP